MKTHQTLPSFWLVTGNEGCLDSVASTSRHMKSGYRAILAAGYAIALWSATTVSAAWGDGSEGLPLVARYDVAPTRGKGAVWSFAQSDDGRLWIGTDQVLIYDGQRFEQIEPKEGYGFHALTHETIGKRERVYAAAVGALGYFERGAGSKWTFVSLEAQWAATGAGPVGEVWHAQTTPHGVAFVTRDRVARWIEGDANQNLGRFETWSLPSSTRLGVFRVG